MLTRDPHVSIDVNADDQRAAGSNEQVLELDMPLRLQQIPKCPWAQTPEGEMVMLRSMKTLVLATLATTMYVASANAASSDSDFDGHDKDHFGIFIDQPHYRPDKCAFDGARGDYVDIDSEIKYYYGKPFKKIEADCKIPFYSYRDKDLDGFKCLLVDKNKYGRDDVLYAKDSNFYYEAGDSYGILSCEFVKRIRSPHDSKK